MRDERQAKAENRHLGVRPTVALLALAAVCGAASVACALDGEWSPVGGALVGPLAEGKGAVKALAVFEDDLVVGGLLSRVGTTTIHNVAAWSGEAWDSLGGGTDLPVDALLPYGDDLVAGGSFTRAGSVSVASVASWDGTRWAPLGAGIEGWVTALHAHDGALIAGGEFHVAGGEPARRIARWDGDAWAPIAEGLGSVPAPRRRRGIVSQEVVYALTTFGGDLIAGGTFASAGDVPVTNVTRWDGAAWYPMGDGLDGEVRVFLEYRGQLVAGGKFRMSGETTVNHIAAWDGEQWRPLGSRLALEPGLGRWVFALDHDGDDLLAGGCFVEIGSEDAEFLARWNGSSWWPIATGLDHCVNALTRWHGDVYAGGSFERAGLGACHYLVRWSR